MARIRTVKPTLFRHVEMFDAERETGLPLRLAFIGLFTAADREGRFKWSPRDLKLDCLPYDDVDFSRVLDALGTRGWVVKYTVDGSDYGYIPTWKKHQVINNRETASVLPKPNENNTLTRAARVDDASTPSLCSAQVEGKGREEEGKGREEEGKGREEEGKGREEESKEERAKARAPADFAFAGNVVRLNTKDFESWTKAFHNLDLLAELTARDAWLASESATDDDRKRWFISTSKYLANRNMEAKAKRGPQTHADKMAEYDEFYRGVL